MAGAPTEEILCEDLCESGVDIRDVAMGAQSGGASASNHHVPQFIHHVTSAERGIALFGSPCNQNSGCASSAGGRLISGRVFVFLQMTQPMVATLLPFQSC